MSENSKVWLNGNKSSNGFEKWCSGFEESVESVHGDTYSKTVLDYKNDCWKSTNKTNHNFICEKENPPRCEKALFNNTEFF